MFAISIIKSINYMIDLLEKLWTFHQEVGFNLFSRILPLSTELVQSGSTIDIKGEDRLAAVLIHH